MKEKIWRVLRILGWSIWFASAIWTVWHLDFWINGFAAIFR